MKFLLLKSSDFYEKDEKEIEINSIEDLKKLQIKMQEEHLENCKKPEFSKCKLIINFCTTKCEKEQEEKPYIMIYDYYME